MRLKLIGHDRRFAVEQAVFNYFPKRDGGSAVVKLSPSGRLASVIIEYNGKRASGRAWATQHTSTDNALRLAFYRAAKQIIKPPPWGALTGVRPVKKAVELLDRGVAPEPALQSLYGVSPSRARLAAHCAAAAASLRGGLDRRDIALYIGIPFCPTRCAYCSFVSQSVGRDAGLTDRYIEVLQEEMALAGQTVSRLGLRIRAVYWGGGTPAVLPCDRFSSLFHTLRRCFPLEFCFEHTVEAGRPDAVSPEKLATYKKFGVTRVSVNPQTLDQAVLDAIGRRHTVEDFFSAFGQARAAGFDCVNTDLIAGLPGEDEERFGSGLEQIIRLCPENITVHTLAKKRSSFLTTPGIEIPPPVSQLYQAGYKPYYLYRQKFTEGGFENTGWAKPGCECRYNLMMMEELCTVLSLGAGGVTKTVKRLADGSVRISRMFHCKYPLEYIAGRDTMGDNQAAFAASMGE
jgi:oxygen-independent coproporphyrinogen-3 oxidase